MSNSGDILSRLEEDEQNLFAPNMEEGQIFVTGEFLMNLEVCALPTLLDPIFPKTGIICIAGSSDTGKSAFARHLAVAVVLGEKKFMGMNLNFEHRKAIYVSSEDFTDSLSFLLQKLNNEYECKPNEFNGLKFILETNDLVEKLENLLQNDPVDLVILDTFGDLYGKSMNDSVQVRFFLNDFSQLAQKFNCLIVVLHHTGKRTEEFAPSKNNLLGSQGLESKVRLVVELRLDKQHIKKRHLCIVKGNYLPREFKECSYVLEMSENFYFTNTRERVPFEELTGNDDSHKLELENEVLQLHKNGKNQIEIATKLGTNQTKVSRILKKNNV